MIPSRERIEPSSLKHGVKANTSPLVVEQPNGYSLKAQNGRLIPADINLRTTFVKRNSTSKMDVCSSNKYIGDQGIRVKPAATKSKKKKQHQQGNEGIRVAALKSKSQKQPMDGGYSFKGKDGRLVSTKVKFAAC